MALVARMLQRSRLSSPASWRLFSSKAGETGAISPDVYASEEHRWDQWDASSGNPRDSRFPSHVSVVEGGPQISMPDFLRIIRHSLMDPGYGFSYSHSMRDPPYQYQPAIHHRRMATGPEAPRPASLQPPAAALDASIYHPEDRTSALQQDARDARFPPNISVVEGGPRVSTADFPSVLRHSLMDPGYSLREPSYPL